MPGSTSNATFDLHLETPPYPSHAAPARSDDQELYEELEITFNKTLEGHYRHGKTGYKRVGALFLTWKEDDLQCKETEVDALRDLFTNEFKYETYYFEIPKDRWQTALQKRIADLFYEYDSPDCLTIIYYGGHGYVGGETQSLKLSAKVEPEAFDNRTLFMNDILGCCRLPACDQLLILDCCHAANAFGPAYLGKRKFEMIVSSGCSNMVPAPQHPGSFTKSLNHVLRKLLEDNKAGFVTSQLYREIYHSIPHNVKPWLFDQAGRDYGRIWLRPQVPSAFVEAESKRGPAYLNLTLKLNKEPNSLAMNELAQSLQYLPHIDQVRFEKLYAPKKQIENFMQIVRQATKLRPLIRKMHAKRRFRELMALSKSEMVPQRPLSLMKLYMDQKHSSTFDWSSALDDHNPSPSSPAIHRRRKSFTWPPVEPESSKKETSFSNRFFSVDYQLTLPKTPSVSRFFQPRRLKTTADSTAASRELPRSWDISRYRNVNGALTSVLPVFDTGRGWSIVPTSDELWHTVMWLTLCYALWCFCYHMKE